MATSGSRRGRATRDACRIRRPGCSASESIRETARIVGRDGRPVHRNLVELEALHLIGLVEEGQAKRPHGWYDGIELDLPLDGPEPASDAAPT